MEHTNFDSEFNKKYSLITRKILRMLSEDSRTSISSLSKSLGVSRATIKNRVDAIEKALQIHYTLELDEKALHISNPRFVSVRFSSKPDYAEIARMLRESYIPQFAATAKGAQGDYLFIYANSPSADDYIHWDKTMQIKMSKYKVLWESSEIAHKQLGFFPARNELIDKLDINDRYKTILKILNDNSRITFHQISQKTGMHFNTVAYYFNNLLKLGYVKKFTLVCKPQNDVHIEAIFGKYMLADDFESDAARIRKVFKADEELSAFSRYPVIFQLIGTHDFFDIGVFDSQKAAYENFVSAYRTILKRHVSKLYHCRIGDAILGYLPVRSVDDSKEYSVMKWTTDEPKAETNN